MVAGMTFLALVVSAQGGGGGPGGTGGPIDGGISALVIGSAYYGYKKLKANRKEKGE